MDTASLTGSGTGMSHHDMATILVIEDDAPTRQLIRRMLEFEGFTVVEAPDGMVGLALLEPSARAIRPIDLVVTDFNLPGIRGDVVAALVRHRLPALPLLCISGDPSTAVPAFPHEAITHFLAKPFSAAGLLQHVRELLATAH